MGNRRIKAESGEVEIRLYINGFKKKGVNRNSKS